MEVRKYVTKQPIEEIEEISAFHFFIDWWIKWFDEIDLIEEIKKKLNLGDKWKWW